jgi:hypothetical protein
MSMRQRNELFIPYGRLGPDNGGSRVDMRVVLFFGVVLVLLGLAGWLYLRQSSEVAQLASEVREQQLRKEDLHRELVTLNAEVAMLGSLQRVRHYGIEKGYRLANAGDATRQLSITCPGCRTLDAGYIQSGSAVAQAAVDEPAGAWQGLTDGLRGWLRPWSQDGSR